MTNFMIEIPDKVTPEWLEWLEAQDISKREKNLARKAAEKREAEAKAKQEIDAVDATRRERRNAALHDLTEEEIDQCALISVDPVKGIQITADKLNRLIETHTQPHETKRKGNINTLMDYVLAYIFLMEDVKLSKKPLHDLRNVHTEEDAEKCGISHRNLGLIWKSLMAIDRNRKANHIGNEDELIQLTRTYLRDAEKMREQQAEAEQALSKSMARKKRREYAEQARRAFNVNPVNPQVQNTAKNAEGTADRGNEGSVDFSVYEGNEGRVADRGPRDEQAAQKIHNENKELLKKLGA